MHRLAGLFPHFRGERSPSPPPSPYFPAQQNLQNLVPLLSFLAVIKEEAERVGKTRHMTHGTLTDVLRHIRRLVGPRDEPGVTDRDLLESFLRRQDEAAFAALVARHGPMVLGVCRNILQDGHDVEDAFQATFLVLVRKAGSVARRDLLAPWLYGVAYRVAVRARANAARRRAHEREGGGMRAAMARDDAEARELGSVLHEEINRLPAKYRAAVVLCCLEGRTREEAAQRLGCTAGSVKGRLECGRVLLRGRLVRRGLTLSAATFATVLSESAAPAAVPGHLLDATVKAALISAAADAVAAGAVSAQVTALTQGVLKAMMISKLRLAVVLLLALGGRGAGALAYRQRAVAVAEPPQVQTPALALRDKGEPQKAADKGEDERERLYEVASTHEGIVLVVGTEIKEGEKLPPDRIVTVKVAGEVMRYRRLRKGDAVEEEQLLARLDDRVAREEVSVAEAKFRAAKADLTSSEKTRDEANHRWRQHRKLPASEEDVRGAELIYYRYRYEAESKVEAVNVAGGELNVARTKLDLYHIRSPVRGVITRIYKHRGEGVKALESVLQIRTAED